MTHANDELVDFNKIQINWDNYEYSIYNLQGQKVDCGKTVSININCTNLNEGIYFVKIQNEYLSKLLRSLKNNELTTKSKLRHLKKPVQPVF